MHTTIDYTELPEKEKREKALQDCREWLGDRFDPMIEAVRKDIRENCPEGFPKEDISKLAKCLAFAGIQGYPAIVLAEHIVNITH